MKQIALIGPTASGKTALSIQLAKATNAYILSLDSLAIYKEIDIASAKPTAKERDNVMHFGIDMILPCESFDVTTYIKLYKEVSIVAREQKKNLIIVGGSSFYLKMLINGISELPNINTEVKDRVKDILKNPAEAYDLLSDVDPEYMKNIEPTDSYRIEKMLSLYLQTKQVPSEYFVANPPRPAIIDPLPVYEIEMDRELLRERIVQRTDKMLLDGLIDEVTLLEKKYGRRSNCMKSIGIKETLEYLDGVHSKSELAEKISIHTGRLAKRQVTFNRSQFTNKFTGSGEDILNKILSLPYSR